MLNQNPADRGASSDDMDPSIELLLTKVAEVTSTTAFTKAQIIMLAAIMNAAVDAALDGVAQKPNPSISLIVMRLEALCKRINWIEWTLLVLAVGNAVVWYWLSVHV